EDGIRYRNVTGVQTCALPIFVLDAADGNMARTARHFSPVGEWLEGVGAYFLVAGFHVAGGIGAWLALVRGAAVTSWPATPALARSEERRVGKEGRCGWGTGEG